MQVQEQSIAQVSGEFQRQASKHVASRDPALADSAAVSTTTKNYETSRVARRNSSVYKNAETPLVPISQVRSIQFQFMQLG